MTWEAAESGLKGFLCPVAFMPIISCLMVIVDVPLPSFVLYIFWLVIVEHIFFFVFWYQKYQYAFHWQVILHANFLGFLASISLRLFWESLQSSPTWPGHYPLLSISLYIIILCVFHFSEFLVTALYNSNTLTIDSFLLNHSTNYHLALLLSVVEFVVECYFLPCKYTLWWCIPLGTIVCLLGEAIRKAGMITAGQNFSHVIVHDFHEEHVLITNGIYGWCRHPSYLGWFLWSIGTQILLINPICMIGYAVASWRFFECRIYEEECTLIQFFGERYLDYKKKVASGLPLIQGYQ